MIYIFSSLSGPDKLILKDGEHLVMWYRTALIWEHQFHFWSDSACELYCKTIFCVKNDFVTDENNWQ